MSVDQFLLSADTTDLNYPEIRPSLNLNFARTKTLDPRITFTRGSGGSYVSADGLIKYAGVNEARFDHDPETGESLGLLIEEARTNLLLRSEEFNNAYWNKNNGISVQLTSILSPSGSQNVYKVIENTNNSSHNIFRGGLSVLPSNIYTFSIYLKISEIKRNKVFLRFDRRIDTGGPLRPARFNLIDGTIENVGSELTASIQKLNNGWYRCSITINTPVSLINAVVELSDNETRTYTGDGTSGIYIWGAQLEAGAFPTSYIPTQGSTRTRQPDNASITGKNFSSWYNPNEGSIFCSAKGIDNIDVSNFTRRYYELNESGSINSRIIVGYDSSTTVRFLTVRNGIAEGLISENNQSPFKNTIRSSVGFKNNDVKLYSNSLGADPTRFGALPVVNSLHIGYSGTIDPSPPARLNGHVSRLTYFPKRLLNSNLQALTR
jgi:hypothetical protein